LNWAVSAANGLAGGSYDLQVQGTGLGTIGTVADLRLSLANGVVGTAGTNAGTTSNPQINRTALSVSNLGNTFYVASVNAITTPLPLRFVSFTAQGENGRVVLTWETAAEINNDHFVVQRSDNTANWLEIDSVKGANNGGAVSSYVRYDEHPLEGMSYYRIEQIDIDGKASYSTIRAINLNAASAKLIVSPNPATTIITIHSTIDEPLRISILNSSGQVVAVPSITNGSARTFTVSAMPPGIYFFRIEHDHFTETRKVVVKK
jgi:hypothetical protein